jgi:dTDP-4-amino-4,6-dideoxygalactose transaminase/nucleoside-diphosphate-sugar epimerase
MPEGAWVVLGGAGFVGSAVRARLHAEKGAVSVLDVVRPRELLPGESYLACDLRTDQAALPPGHVVLAFGRSMPRPVRPWTLVLDNALTTARLGRALAGRDATLLSSVEVYGRAPGPLAEETEAELPVSQAALDEWVAAAWEAAAEPVSPHRSVQLCRALSDLDPSGRWVYGVSKLAQEKLLERAVGVGHLTVLRLANVIGQDQHRVVGRMVESMLAGVPCSVTRSVRGFVSVEDVARVVALRPGPGTFNVSAGCRTIRDVALTLGTALGVVPDIVERDAPADDSCGEVDGDRLSRLVGGYQPLDEALERCARDVQRSPGPMFPTPLRVVIPPRPHRPDLVVDRIAACLWSGSLRGGRWSLELAERLSERLGLGPDRRVLLTSSGTTALRLALWAAAGPPAPGAVALCPAYTFHATAEVLRQLGWTVRLLDVDPWTWTLDPELVAAEVTDPDVRVVVAVDALGNPADYARLRLVCGAAGVPLVADSAPSLGAVHDGRAVGAQADAHAFSMSFAKTVSGAGSGGAVVVGVDADLSAAPNWLRSSVMTEPSAVAALDQLEVVDELVGRRATVARIYREALLGRPGFSAQHVRPGDGHALVHWAMRVPPAVGRDRLAARLAAEGVQSKPYYEPLLERATRSLPVTSALHREALALPMSSELSVDEAERVATAAARSLRDLVSERGQVPVQQRTGDVTA